MGNSIVISPSLEFGLFTQILTRYHCFMCGRYAQTQEMRDLVEEFAVTGKFPDNALPASWNIAPTKKIYIVRNSSDNQRELAIVSWGMIGHWLKDENEARASQSRAINARSESIFEKPTFRDSFKSRRCLIPADGYYEWATELGKYKTKQPFYITSDDGHPLSIAGIWNTWRAPSGKVVESASIITREAVGDLAKIHHRMPLMMPRDRWGDWLDIGEHSTHELIDLMKVAAPDARLHPIPVSDAVNKVANDGPELVIPITIAEPETLF
ncbi:MAG: SOS response-associated peptidase [Candidatus Nanopelagicaceae bacterium]